MFPKHPTEEMSTISELASCGIAITQMVDDLAGSRKWSYGSHRWIKEPNFVTITIQPKKRALRFTIRGRTSEFNQFIELSLKRGRAGAYSEFVFEKPRQLAAATFYIQHAYELFQRGGARRKRQQVIEET